ncbi:hypothetical protein D9M71_807490 [compost metagenome]
MFIAAGAAQVHRAADLGEGTWPGFQHAVDQVLTLFDLAVETVFFRDAAGVGKQVAKNLCGRHVATPCVMSAVRLWLAVEESSSRVIRLVDEFF